MCRKHFEPHKCEFVPVDEIVLFCKKNRQLMEKILLMYMEYLRCLESRNRYAWTEARKKMMFSPEWKILNALILAQFNYEDSYINCGDAGRRFVREFIKHRDKIIASFV